jgi:hypothetical protein
MRPSNDLVQVTYPASFELSGVNAQVAVSGLHETLQFIERQRLVDCQGTHDTQTQPLVNEAIERECTFVRAAVISGVAAVHRPQRPRRDGAFGPFPRWVFDLLRCA